MIEINSSGEYRARRAALIDLIQKNHGSDGAIVLFAGFEPERTRFRQESSFFYFTGIQEPGVVLWLELNGQATLFIPDYGGKRATWVPSALEATEESAAAVGVDHIEYLGQQCDGYQLYPFFNAQGHEKLLKRLEQGLQKKASVFSLNPSTPYGYVEQRFMLNRLDGFVPDLLKATTDISPLVARLRRKKSEWELANLLRAVDITSAAQLCAAHAIEPGRLEHEIQAFVEGTFTSQAGQIAFPSIVAGGKNATVLHYHQNNNELKDGDLVVVDIGAEYGNYCADITRTYPVSGVFSKRQRELYQIVLDTQEYIADLAAPGYWLSNKEQPDKSLNHLARAFLKEHGYDKYFPHGIGHFLGLDVHDVGDVSEPLKEGDVFTIEPGIYIPEEGIGIRIEDNYVMARGSALCLSDELPNDLDDIEEMMCPDEDEEPTLESFDEDLHEVRH